MKNFAFLLLLLLLLLLDVPRAFGALRVGFYSSSCPQAETIVQGVVQKHFANDKSITGGLLRMYFHDCFINGCDASILIDSIGSTRSEKEAGPNLTVRGYEIIDEAKEALENACPSTVSCADVIVLATRDSVTLAGGPKFSIPTGRLDGLVSNEGDIVLAGPDSSVLAAFQNFRAKGFNLKEMVTLLGAHTVGNSICGFFKNRLDERDPTMDPTLAHDLNLTCTAQPSSGTFLDQGTPFLFDNEFYNQIKKNKGILRIDQELALDKSTAAMVTKFSLDGRSFSQSFVKAIVKMGNLINKSGNIRKNCRVFNR